MDFKIFFNSIIVFLLSLYGDPALPRKVVQIVIDYVISLLHSVLLPNLKNDITQILISSNVSESVRIKIDICFEQYKNVFDSFSTEANRFSILKKNGYLEPEEKIIRSLFIEKIKENETILVPENAYATYIPLRHSLKCFLEIPGLFQQIISFMNKLSKETTIISNVLLGELWKRKYLNTTSDILMPIYISYDDIESGNALGSHAGVNKFGAVYAMIACLPPHVSSKLNSIIFTMLFYSEDRKRFGNKIFMHLIDELNYLRETGILVINDDKCMKVKFQFFTPIGDNLGLNSMLGFMESFKALSFCRICKLKVQETYTATIEEPNSLRTAENYEEDVKSDNPKEEGIKEPCIFNLIKNFNVIENSNVDLMHDLFEGVCVYVMRSLLFTFIFVQEKFTLEELNFKVQNFKYGESVSNKPPIITYNKIKKKFNLKMSASEMLCFVRYFSLIMGDKINLYDEHYQLYIYLRKILDIVCSPRYTKTDVTDLIEYIKEHNSLYIKFYGNLKPKFHFLIHYARLLLKNGPLLNTSAMRFESENQRTKSAALSSSNKKNLILTVAIKQALVMCKTFNDLNFSKNIVFGTVLKMPTNMNRTYYNDVTINGIKYKINTCIVVDISKSEKVFGQVIQIFEENNEISFEMKIVNEITFREHFYAYVVKNTEKTVIEKFENLPVIMSVTMVSLNNTLYIIVPYKL